MKPFWMRELLRNAEGEGGGGGTGSGGASSGTGGDASPPSDKMDAIEARLNRIASSVEGFQQNQRQNSAMNAIRQRDGQLQQAKADAENAVTQAEQKLATAFDDGDGMQIARAQRELSQSVAKVERADAELVSFRNDVKRAQAEAQQQSERGGNSEELDATNLNAWKSKHASWYGVDAGMTKAAHEIDRQIRDAGVLSVGSQEYFDAVDRQMSQRFPDHFGGTPPTGGSGGPTPAPNTRNKGRVQQSIADGWRRMGINVDDPKTLDRMINVNRQKAVDKGILSPEPVRGGIISR